jgi:hypothetical protein
MLNKAFAAGLESKTGVTANRPTVNRGAVGKGVAVGRRLATNGIARHLTAKDGPHMPIVATFAFPAQAKPRAVAQILIVKHRPATHFRPIQEYHSTRAVRWALKVRIGQSVK